MDHYVSGIINELTKPENRDLLLAVVSHLGENDSFMFTFVTTEPMSFEEFSVVMPQIDGLITMLKADEGVTYQPEAKSLQERYTEYLNEDHSGRINRDQTKRFDAIISKFDNGWSGAMFGLIMRSVQAELRKTQAANAI